jgi:hypothetical protein
MRSIFIATMILFLLTACGADTQPAAPTATVTISATFTLTPTKAPAATTTPVESQLPEGVQELAKKLEGSNYKLTLNEQKEIVYVYVDPETKDETTIPELIVNPDGNGATRKYIFTQEGYEPAELEVAYTTDELVSRDFSAWKIENGQWIRKKVVALDGITTEMLKYSKQEIGEIIAMEANRLGQDQLPGTKSKPLSYELLGFNGSTLTIRSGGFEFGTASLYTYFNRIDLIDTNGNKVGIMDSPLYSYVPLTNDNQSVVALKLKGIITKIFVDGNLGTSDVPLTKIQSY